MRYGLAALLFSFCAASAGAQTIYKSIMPDGKIVYGEKPVPGAKKVETIEAPPAKTGVTAATPQEQARAAELRQRQATRTEPAAQAEDAQLALKNAEAAREAGREPLPDERQGLAGGGSRLTEAYFARQKILDAAVEAARQRAEEASR
jgi:Domain of unknown function (DUF4124)